MFFSGPKSKTKLILIGTEVSFQKKNQKLAAIKQHAIVEKRACEGVFFISCSYSLWFGLNVRHMRKAYDDDPHAL